METSKSAPDGASSSALARRRSWGRRAALALAVALVVYLLVAYVAMPTLWKGYAHRHPALDDAPGITVTGDGHPGDPINVSLVGSDETVHVAMRTAGWYEASKLGLRSDARIALDTVLERPFDQAPVSALFLFGRKEDLAFELPAGDDPVSRHHVRFWRSPKTDEQGRTVWLGSAAFDKRVELSRTTGQVTHHISPDVDAERDFLLSTLRKTSPDVLSGFDYVADFHEIRDGFNGGGDPWRTDGRLLLMTLEQGLGSEAANGD